MNRKLEILLACSALALVSLPGCVVLPFGDGDGGGGGEHGHEQRDRHEGHGDHGRDLEFGQSQRLGLLLPDERLTPDTPCAPGGVSKVPV